MDIRHAVRKLLLEQLQGGNAHVEFNRAVEGLEWKNVGRRAETFPHSTWELVKHIQITQHDILDFSRNPGYQAISWPEEYWPDSLKPKDQKQWDDTIEAFHRDHRAMIELISDPEHDLLEPLAHGDGQTLFREAMLIVDHNAYHIGQIVMLRKALENW